MNITYEIIKKRGRFRPELKIKILQEPWEKTLNPEYQKVEIKVPHNYSYNKPSESQEEEHESKTIAKQICVNDNSWNAYLPYRPGKNPAYPEVGKALNELQKKHEAAVLEAYNSLSFNRTGTIEPSKEFKKKIAPWVAKQKMMKEVENE